MLRIILKDWSDYNRLMGISHKYKFTLESSKANPLIEIMERQNEKLESRITGA
jgi:hypothetical protein